MTTFFDDSILKADALGHKFDISIRFELGPYRTSNKTFRFNHYA